jgi:hypothetical protein
MYSQEAWINTEPDVDVASATSGLQQTAETKCHAMLHSSLAYQSSTT